MREFNGVKIIGIDHGYDNIKTGCTATPTGLRKSKKFDKKISKKYLIFLFMCDTM